MDHSRHDEDTNNFTLLRLMLSVAVVLGHFKLLCGASTERFPYNLADAAVDAFFVVSGFLITGSFERSRSVLSFYVRRVFRVVPLYALVVLIQTALMASFLPGGPFSALRGTFTYLIFNLCFLNFAQHDIGGILQSRLIEPTLNPSLWTLKIEMGFYVISPAVFFAIRRWGGGVLIGIFTTSALFQLVAIHAGLGQYARQLPGQMQFFAVGIGLYYYARNIRVTIAIAAAVPIIFVAAWTWLWPIPVIICPLIVGAFVFCFALCLPPLPLHSDLSYGVYLQHGPLIQTLLFLGLLRDRSFLLGGVLLVVIALSVATERLVEQPGIALGKRFARYFERPLES